MRGVVVLILGIALGATIGLLAAPQTGGETRKAFVDRYQEWRAKGNGDDSDEG